MVGGGLRREGGGGSEGGGGGSEVGGGGDEEGGAGGGSATDGGGVAGTVRCKVNSKLLRLKKMEGEPEPPVDDEHEDYPETKVSLLHLNQCNDLQQE